MSGSLVTFARELAMRALDILALLEARWDKVGNEPQMIILFFIVDKQTLSLNCRTLLPKIVMLTFKTAVILLVAAHRVFY